MTAVALVAVLGFRWTLLGAMAVELVPGLELFPAWTLMVVALAATDNSHPPASNETTQGSARRIVREEKED